MKDCGWTPSRLSSRISRSDALMVDRHAAAAEFDRDAPITIAAAMLKHDLLDGVAHFHLFLAGIAGLKGTIESGAADLSQPAHRLDSKAVCGRHHFPDRFPDAVSPEPVAVRAKSLDLFAGSLQKIHFERLLRPAPSSVAAFSRRSRSSAT